MVEKAYIQWLRNEFFLKENAFCYVLEEEGVWISALRILIQLKNMLIMQLRFHINILIIHKNFKIVLYNLESYNELSYKVLIFLR